MMPVMCTGCRLLPSALLLFLLCLSTALGFPAKAADQAGQSNSLAQLSSDIEREQRGIDELEQRLDGASGITKVAIDSRRLRERMNLLEMRLNFLGMVAAEKAAGTATEEILQRASGVFDAQLKTIDTTVQILAKQIVLPDEKQSPAETAATYSRIFQRIDQVNRVYEIDIETIDLGEQLGLQVATLRDELKRSLRDRAENGSVFLELAISDLAALRASIAAVPDDAESRARLKVVSAHIGNLAAEITRILGMMKSLEMDTTQYQNQLLLATGQITADIFQFDVFTNLFLGWGETLWNQVIDKGPGLIFNLVLLLVIVLVFYKLAGVAQRLTERGLDKAQVQLSLLLKRMTVSIVRNTVLLVGVLIALSQIGISLGPVLAGMGLVGFVIGFALQDTLSNFAAGMLILVYRPFDVDDIIEAGGVTGKVSAMSLVNTTFLTFDNQTIIVPNGKIWGDVIKNVTAQTMRRIDLVFGIAYGDDIEKAEKIMAEVVAAHPAVLAEPETMIRLHELGDSSVNFVVRPWVNKDDYWETYWALTRAMKLRFDKEGISIPFPQRDVHLFQETTD